MLTAVDEFASRVDQEFQERVLADVIDDPRNEALTSPLCIKLAGRGDRERRECSWFEFLERRERGPIVKSTDTGRRQRPYRVREAARSPH